MILELAQQVEKFLHAHNKPPTKSFYDDMMSRKKLQEEQEEQKRQESLARLKEKEEKQVKSQNPSSRNSNVCFITNHAA